MEGLNSRFPSNLFRMRREVQRLKSDMELPSGPAFGTRDAYATNLINSNDFFVVCQTHEDITLLLAADYSIDGAVETPCFPILGGENVR